MTKRFITAAMLLLFAQTGLTVGLGEIQPQSNLGQPLKAVIPVTDASEWSKEQIKIKLSGVSEAVARSVTVLMSGTGGRQHIELTTEASVNEPYIGFTVQISWPEGSLKRDYELLLDPPSLK
jgi:pilus assembly protein FimV